MDDLLLDRIDSLLEHIDFIEEDIKGKTFDEFCESSMMVRATCFSLVQIVEQMISLERHFKKANIDIPWKSARDMRNIIVHVYNKVNFQEVYKTITTDLPNLKKAFVETREKMVAEA